MLLSIQTPVDYPQNLILELDDGEEFPIQKIYHVGGKFKVLTCDPHRKNRENELESLKRDYKILEDEEKDAQREIAQLETELLDMGEKHEKELNQIENTIEDLELQLKIQTSARSIKDRIQELAEKLLNK